MLNIKFNQNRQFNNFFSFLIFLLVTILIIYIFIHAEVNFTTSLSNFFSIAKSFSCTLLLFSIFIILLDIIPKEVLHLTTVLFLSVIINTNLFSIFGFNIYIRIIICLLISINTTYIYLNYPDFFYFDCEEILKIFRKKILIIITSTIIFLFILMFFIFLIINNLSENFLIFYLFFLYTIFFFIFISYISYILSAMIVFNYLNSDKENIFQIIKNLFLSTGTALKGTLLYILVDFYVDNIYIIISGIRIYPIYNYILLYSFICPDYCEKLNRWTFIIIALTGNEFYKCAIDSFNEIEMNEHTHRKNNSVFILLLLLANLSIFLLTHLIFPYERYYIIGSLCALIFTLCISFILDGLEKSLFILKATEENFSV